MIYQWKTRLGEASKFQAPAFKHGVIIPNYELRIMNQVDRKYGYIWGVYVEPAYRKKGIARQLTRMAIAYLKSLDCTRVILHASPSGKPVYTPLGFSESNEMRLDLI